MKNNYKIWIGADTLGNPLIGAKACEHAVVTEHIYPSQMRHRCIVHDSNGRPMIVTPTEAKAQGRSIVARFPKADGAKGRAV